MEFMDEELLVALFEQSRLSLKKESIACWKKELEHWVEFFSLDAGDLENSRESRAPVNVDFREDEITQSLGSAQVKALGPRLVDGFFALPKGSQKGVNSEQH